MAKNNRTVDRVQAMLNFIGGEQNLDLLLEGRAKLTFERIYRLTPLSPVRVESNISSPHDFFKTRQGLDVSDRFRSYVVSRAPKVNIPRNRTMIGYGQLLLQVNEPQLAAELPSGYVFKDFGVFLLYLGFLLKTQWGGSSGALLTTGRLNIFYVVIARQVVAVCVGMDRKRIEWRCDIVKPDMFTQWGVGNRVFSATLT